MNPRKRIQRAAAGLLSCVMAACGMLPLSGTAGAESRIPAAAMESPETSLYETQLSYSDYYDRYGAEDRPDAEIRIAAAAYMSASGGSFSVGSYGAGTDAKADVLIWDSAEGTVTYRFSVTETGIYCAELVYYPMVSQTNTTALQLLLDGASPYETASRLSLPKCWVNARAMTTDRQGNQIRPPQVQQGKWMTGFLQDVDGLFNDPLIFYLEAGTHTLTLTGDQANLALATLTFRQPEKVPAYTPPTDAALQQTSSTLLRLEGEDAAYKSDATLYPTYDNVSYQASPASPDKLLYNTIGKGNWKKATQTITWEIGGTPETRLPQDGWYRIGIKARQQDMRGLYSNRRLLVDGKVPCEPMAQLRFFYDTDWSLVSPETADGAPVYVYLTADKVHTLSLEVIPGEIGASMRQLDGIVRELNACYRKILMITGPNPDRYTDYSVQERIPGLLTELQSLHDALASVQGEIEALSGAIGSEAAALARMTRMLEKCLQKPDRIPDYLAQMKDNITAISAWMRDYRDQPLEIDYIELASPDMAFSAVQEHFGKQLVFSFRSFLGSFTRDYTTLSAAEDTQADALQVWVQQGRDQAQVVKELVESRFVQETGIPVAVNLVVGGIVEAALADKQPDVALFIGGDLPVNLAARELLVDLTQFSDYEETKAWFQTNATVPYTYEGGVYGLPVTQSWPMLFYRRDILAELGFTAPPKTWDALIAMLPALQRRYMGVGLVLPGTNVSPATEAGHTFAMLALQSGVNYYNDAQTKTNFDDVRAVQAFTKWTDFYTKYGFAQTYDAFSRFRTGVYPMVIANYTFYNQLTVASPEIKGLWDFTTVPGTVQADGTISHAANSAGTAAVLFRKAANPEAAWKLIRWFSSAEIQTAYGTQIEGLLGQMGRFEAANTAALSQLSWSPAALRQLLAQRSALSEVPVIPASYAVTRNLMNAFRETVNNVYANPRETLLWYNRDSNAEIKRKRENLHLQTD